MSDSNVLRAFNDNIVPIRVGASAVVGNGAHYGSPPMSASTLLTMPRGLVPPPTIEILEWHKVATEKLTAYAQLKPGWDTYNGRPLRIDTGYFAMAVLCSVMTDATPIPQIVPTPAGGVQFEWHVGQRDIEFAVDAPYDCELWYRDLVTGVTGGQPVNDGNVSSLAAQLALL